MTSRGPNDLAALIAEVAEGEDEARLFSRVLTLLPLAADEVAPPPSMRADLLARLRADDGRGPRFAEGDLYFARGDLLDWSPIAPGIEARVLYSDAATGAQTLLVRLEPNVQFPPHGHETIEDLYLVAGDAWVGEVAMRPGDYCRAPVGSEHNDIRSGPSGALAVSVSR